MGIAGLVLVCFFDTFAQFPVVAPYARLLGAGPALVGLVVAIYSITNLVGNLVSGYLLDRVDRRQVLVAGLSLAGLALFLYAGAQTPAHLVLVRAAHGGAVSVVAPAAFAILGDRFPRGQRKAPMGASGALIALAAIVAPAISGFLRDRLGYIGVFFFVGALLLLTAAATWRLMSPTRPDHRGHSHSPAVFLALLNRPSLLVAYLAGTVLTFGLGSLVGYLPLHMADLGFGGAQTGLALSAFAVVAMVAMLSPLSRLGGDGTRLLTASAGLLLVALALFFLPLSSGLQAIWASMALYGLGFGLIFPAANARVADATDYGERGAAFGLFYAFWSVGVILGSSVSGLAVEQGMPLSPFHLAAALAVPSALVVALTAPAPAAETAPTRLPDCGG